MRLFAGTMVWHGMADSWMAVIAGTSPSDGLEGLHNSSRCVSTKYVIRQYSFATGGIHTPLLWASHSNLNPGHEDVTTSDCVGATERTLLLRTSCAER